MAVAALDRALALNPNAAHAWRRGLIHTSRNQPEAAIEAIERPRRLSPFDPYTFLYALYIALAHLAARRFEQAIEWADRALHEQPRMVAAMRSKVAANAYPGRLDEARAELSRVLAIDRSCTGGTSGGRARSARDRGGASRVSERRFIGTGQTRLAAPGLVPSRLRTPLNGSPQTTMQRGIQVTGNP